MASARKPHGIEKLLAMPVLPVRDQVIFPGLVNTIHVAREMSRTALELAVTGSRLVWVVSQKDMALEAPTKDDLNSVGTLCEVLHHSSLPDGSNRVALRAMFRAQASRILTQKEAFVADIEELKEIPCDTIETEATIRAVKESFSSLASQHRAIPPESISQVIHAENAGSVADTVLHFLPVQPSEKQVLLEQLSHSERLIGVLHLLKREEEILNIEKNIRTQVEKEITDSQRDFLLREQLRIIQGELDLRDNRRSEVDQYRDRIAEINLPEKAHSAAKQELRRLEHSPGSSSESFVARGYLDVLLSLPWNETSVDNLDIARVAQVLDGDHYGLSQVKERILEFLAVRKLNGNPTGAVLCFIGPPGVGKTSIAKSIAHALGRNLSIVALGGVRDESEIRGHRRAYVGSSPGRIISTIRESGTKNPLMLLDEIDKISISGHGDPSSALLEVLDPEQNTRFVDHHLDTPFDLSEVMFIATANQIEQIPPSLRDRMEFIEFPGYTDAERFEIAKRYVLPQALKNAGIRSDQLTVSDEALKSLSRDHTRESGVRALKREINTLTRKIARLLERDPSKSIFVTQADLTTYLGAGYPHLDVDPSRREIGLVHGLVIAPYGGDMIDIEIALTNLANHLPRLTLTGSMGNVMQESAQTALTCVRRYLDSHGIAWNRDVHIHVSNAGIPKDGPSAGLAIAIAVASAFLDKPVPSDIAITGEIGLRGKTSAVGGIREKILAAKRFGMRRVLFPISNESEVFQLEPEATEDIEVLAITDFEQALSIVFGQAQTVNMR